IRTAENQMTIDLYSAQRRAFVCFSFATVAASGLAARTFAAVEHTHQRLVDAARADSDTSTADYSADMSVPEAERQMKEMAIDVAPHVYAFHAPLPYGPAPLANETLIEQSDGLVLIDAGKTRGAGERIVALIKSISAKPVKAVIITHWHQDHVMGLGPIMEAWPTAKVISSVATRDHILNEKSYAGSPLSLAETGERDRSRAKALAQYAKDYGANLRDPKLSGEERRGWADVVGVLNLRIADERGSYLVVPTVTFTRDYRIDDAIAPVEARAIGRAHTDGDIIVWAPKQRVVASGDMIVSPIPYGGTNVLEWAATLRALRSLHPLAIVPGHGDVETDLTYVDKMIAALTEMTAKATRLASGPALVDDSVQAKIDLSAQRKIFAGDDRWLGYWFDGYFAPNAVEAYDELRKAKGK
ncbi:MAG: MBL fold metallo-hydrolase, partial [Gemmatimonadota bacterium]|nr:MBL fold metallo-hydrolase [Gemmatimonadota bacterium]